MALTAKDLKNAILQMAMEGKLVEQRPEEGTGEELFNQIQKETKSTASNSKSNKSPNSFNIQSDEIPFDIPTSWKWVKSSWILSNIQYGYNGSGIDKGTYRFLRITDIQNGKVNWSSIPFTNIASEEAENYQVKKNDIFIARTGGTIGKSFLLREEKENTIFAGYLIRFQCRDTRIAPYLSWFLNSPFYWKQVEDKKAGTGQPNINGKSLANLFIPLPPLAEQKRIVAKIESILPSLDAFEKAQTKLDELNASYKEGLKKSILQYAMEGKLVSQDPKEEPASALLDRIQEEKKKLIKEKKIKADKNESVIFRRNGFFYERIGKEEKCIDDEIPFEIPESWEWTRLKNIASTQLGKALNTSKDQGELVPYLCSINVYWNTIDVSQVKKARFSVDEKKKFSVQPGDIFVVEGGDAGRTAIWEGKDQVYYQNALHRVRFLPKAIVPLFFVFLMKTYKGLGLLGGKSKGMTIQHFVKHELDALLFPLPAFAEQKRIVATIKTIFTVLDGN